MEAERSIKDVLRFSTATADDFSATRHRLGLNAAGRSSKSAVSVTSNKQWRGRRNFPPNAVDLQKKAQKKDTSYAMSHDVRSGAHGRHKFVSASFTPSQGGFGDHGFLRGSKRRISATKSKVIVSYLRRQLRQRLQEAVSDDLSQSDEETTSDDAAAHLPHGADFGRHNMFSRYTDHGGRISRKSQVSPEGERSDDVTFEGRDLSPVGQQNTEAVLPQVAKGVTKGSEKKRNEILVADESVKKIPLLSDGKILIDPGERSGAPTVQNDAAHKPCAPKTVEISQKGFRSASPALSVRSLRSNGSSDCQVSCYGDQETTPTLPKIGPIASGGPASRQQSATTRDDDVRLPAIGKEPKLTENSTSRTDCASEMASNESCTVEESSHSLPYDDTDGCLPRREEISPVPNQYPLIRDMKTAHVDQQNCMDQLMKGCFDVEFPLKRKFIRVYISSTYSDFEAERTALISKVYPRLRGYCKERGYEFQASDPNWGIKAAIDDTHTHADHCLSELAECQRVSVGPNFVSILGQRYGQEGLPPAISVAEFEAVLSALQRAKEQSQASRRFSRISQLDGSLLSDLQESHERRSGNQRKISTNEPSKTMLSTTTEESDEQQQGKTRKVSDHRMPLVTEESMESGVFDSDVEPDRHTEKDYDNDLTLLKNWFLLDENSVPPCYKLQSISSVFPDIARNDKQKRQRGKNQWLIVRGRLQRLLQRYMRSDDQKNYFLSVTEREIERGLLHQDSHGKALSFQRYITDLQAHVQDYNARDYIDLHPMRPEIDVGSQEKLGDLKEVVITEKLKNADIHEFTVEWHKDGISPTTSRPHAHYLDKFGNEFHDSLKSMIDEAISSQAQSCSALEENANYRRVLPHVKFAQECTSSFHGRQDVLTAIKRYMRSNGQRPLALHGKPGSGKTFLVAKAAELVRDWMTSDNLAVIVRFIGLTAESGYIRTLLANICMQICNIYGHDVSSIPEDYFGLLNDLEIRLGLATADKPLVLFIDAVDQLADENNGRSLAWLPQTLPEHVHLVVTTVTHEEEQNECFKVLKRVLPKDSLLAIPDLGPSGISFILSHRLASCNRQITEEQRAAVTKACEENPVPLYVSLAADEAARWSSHVTGRALFMPATLRKLVNQIIIRLESSYGEPLVRRALGYITASRSGLSWSELNDLLSLDEAVMNDVVAQNATILRRLPPALWCQLRAELEQYLLLGYVDGKWTYRWRHNEFHESAMERYLKQKDKAPSYHSALGEFLMGKWAGVRKPYPGNDGGAERFVDPMPLVWNQVVPGGSKQVYNLRKLNELPYHLLQASQIDKLKTEVLLNYEWTLAKLKATSLRTVLDDIQSALVLQPNDQELRLMSETLQLSAGALQKDPNQLGSQLTGRLYNIIKADKPMSVGDPKKYPTVAAMLGTLNRSSVPLLLPSATCLAQPGGALCDLLAGHTDVITAVTVSPDGSLAGTASKDGTVKLWELKSRKVVKTLPKVGMEVSTIRFALNNHILVSVAHNTIQVWNLTSCSCIKTLNEFIDPPSITIAGETQEHLCAFFSGINAMRTWDLGTEDIDLVIGHEISGQGIHKDGSVCVASGSVGEKVLYAFRSDNKAYVVNAKTGQRVHELKAPGQAASVTALGISKDYYIVVCRYLYMKLSEIHHLELFNIKTGKYEHAVKGCTNDVVNELHVNGTGSHALCLNPSAQSNTSHIAVWNLETEDHKHLAKHTQISTIGACVDLNYCLSASKQDKALRIWNLSKKVNERQGNDSKSKKREGVSSLVPMINNPRYVVAKSIDNGPLSVWNVVKGKCSGSAVRIERGLVDQHDVFLVRNHMAVILSDRGMSSVSEKPTAVFQTVYMYNLKLKKYHRKLTGVFIVPSPAHEYRLLDGELLLGLSESRDHLIAWCLVTGHIKFRIKSKFKELERWRGMRREEEELLKQRSKRGTSAMMTPWDRRSESHTAKQRRRDSEFSEEKKRIEDLRKEKENAIDQYVMSQDEKIIVCCYFAHHMCVFDVETQTHLQTLENESSMLYLYNSALTATGSYLAHANYDDQAKCSYVTLWDLQSGHVRKRIKNEPNVCCVGINNDATRVLFGKEGSILKVWDVRRKSTLRKLRGYSGMRLTMDSKIFMIDGGARAIVFANDISLWNLDQATLIALFSPDIRITCVEVVMAGQLIIMGLRESPDLVMLRLRGRDIKAVDLVSAAGEELFGETTGDTTDDEQEEEDEEGSEVASTKASEKM